jgi:hypothetical protein
VSLCARVSVGVGGPWRPKPCRLAGQLVRWLEQGSWLLDRLPRAFDPGSGCFPIKWGFLAFPRTPPQVVAPRACATLGAVFGSRVVMIDHSDLSPLYSFLLHRAQILNVFMIGVLRTSRTPSSRCIRVSRTPSSSSQSFQSCRSKHLHFMAASPRGLASGAVCRCLRAPPVGRWGGRRRA